MSVAHVRPLPSALPTRTVALPGGLNVSIGEVGDASAAESGAGILVLHGGAGPRSVVGFATALSEHGYIVVPTHPGFDGTPGPTPATRSPTWRSRTWTCSTPWAFARSW